MFGKLAIVSLSFPSPLLLLGHCLPFLLSFPPFDSGGGFGLPPLRLSFLLKQFAFFPFRGFGHPSPLFAAQMLLRIIFIWCRWWCLIYIHELMLGRHRSTATVIIFDVQPLVVMMELARRAWIDATILLHAIPSPGPSLSAIQRANVGSIELIVVIYAASLTPLDRFRREAGSDDQDVDRRHQHDETGERYGQQCLVR